MSNKKLEELLWGAAEFLRGQIDASDYKQYIFPLLFYKRLSDVYLEEYNEAMELHEGDAEYAAMPMFHRFNIPLKPVGKRYAIPVKILVKRSRLRFD